MDESVEARLARLERELAETKKANAGTAASQSRHRAVWLGTGVLLIFLGGAAGFVRLHRATPEPAVITGLKQLPVQTAFDMYYPGKLPPSYTVDVRSISMYHQAVFYNLRSGRESIIISQQQKPSSVESIKKIDGLSETQMHAGKAFIGKTTVPTAILLTDNTLVSFQGSAGVRSSDLYDTVAAMTAVKR